LPLPSFDTFQNKNGTSSVGIAMQTEGARSFFIIPKKIASVNPSF